MWARRSRCWSNLILYMKQYTPVRERTAAYYLTACTGGAGCWGGFVSTPLMKYVSPSEAAGDLWRGECAADGGGGDAAGDCGRVGRSLRASFFLSIMFPTIFALGLKGLGPNTKLAGSLLVMAIVGGAIFPLVLGLDCEDDGEPGAGVYRAAGWVCCGGAVWVSGAADSAGGRQHEP